MREAADVFRAAAPGLRPDGNTSAAEQVRDKGDGQRGGHAGRVETREGGSVATEAWTGESFEGFSRNGSCWRCKGMRYMDA
eukprot:gene14765-11830_t